MTGREFSEVDIDLLADYVGGALDGTPDEAVVAALIADEPAWRTAHDSLAAGMLAVGTDLRAMGADPAPMPADVTARLSAALAEQALAEQALAEQALAQPALAQPALAQPAPAEPALAGSAPEPAPESAADRPRLTMVPGGTSGTAARARRRGLPRWAAPVAVAAGVLACAGFGIDRFWGAANAPETTNGAATTADLDAKSDTPMLASAAPGAAARLVDAPPPERITSSGIDYSAAVLAANVRMGYDRSTPSEQRAPVDQNGVRAESATGVGLERLGDRQALLDCLRAVADEAGTGDITVDTVDYARFAGAPALIVRFTAADGSWAWAAGPDCGTPGAGADTRYRVKVG